MTADELFAEFVAGFGTRKFSAGLLIAFIDFVRRVDPAGGSFTSLDSLLRAHPRREVTAAGQRANTLIVELSASRTISLRPFYNSAERLIRAEHKRFDYPSCAPHATQAWGDYRPWLDALVALSPEELIALRERVLGFVLERLPSQAFDPATVRAEPPLFRILLQEFDLTARRGEPTGAAFQGLVFGFLRADNPHLQVEIDKVRTGSKRRDRVGDIDAWEGTRLAITGEVKQFAVRMDDLPELEAFANEAGRRGSLGLVVALRFEAGTAERISEMGVRPLDREDLVGIVQLWDPVKQRTAVSSLVYYVKHVETNSALGRRVEEFLEAL